MRGLRVGSVRCSNSYQNRSLFMAVDALLPNTQTDFKRRHQKIGDFWLPESNESETKVRVFGTAVLSIEYRDYQITQAGGGTVASPPSEALAATVAEEF